MSLLKKPSDIFLRFSVSQPHSLKVFVHNTSPLLFWHQRGEVGHESFKFLKISASRTQLASDQVHLLLIDLAHWSQWVLLDLSFATLSKGFDEP